MWRSQLDLIQRALQILIRAHILPQNVDIHFLLVQHIRVDEILDIINGPESHGLGSYGEQLGQLEKTVRIDDFKDTLQKVIAYKNHMSDRVYKRRAELDMNLRELSGQKKEWDLKIENLMKKKLSYRGQRSFRRGIVPLQVLRIDQPHAVSLLLPAQSVISAEGDIEIIRLKIENLMKKKLSYPEEVTRVMNAIREEFVRIGRTPEPRILCEL